MPGVLQTGLGLSQTRTVFFVCAFGTALFGQGKRDAGGYPAHTGTGARADGLRDQLLPLLPWNRLDRSRHGRGKSGYVSPGRPRSEWKSHRGGCPRGASKSADIDAAVLRLHRSADCRSCRLHSHLRQQRRYKELIAAKDAGDANLCRRYFNGAGNCRSCHSPESDLAGSARKYDADGLSAHILRPGLSFIREGADAGSIAHLKALENYTLAEVQNLHAYLQTLK